MRGAILVKERRGRLGEGGSGGIGFGEKGFFFGKGMKGYFLVVLGGERFFGVREKLFFIFNY